MILNEKSVFDNCELLTLYGYDGFIRDLIFRYKTMNDQNLHSVFLEPFIKEINKQYKDYTLLFPPSSRKAMEQRGFSHMELICKTTNLDYLSFFYKTDNHKQSLVKSVERKINAEKINYFTNITLPNKILLIDDILTTGSTIKACLAILQKLNVKDIKILIIAKSLKVIN